MQTTFNRVTVDGDRSTNDTCLLFATGQSAAPRIARAGDRRLADFRDKLQAVMLDLAGQISRPECDVTYVFYVAEEIARSYNGLLALAAELGLGTTERRSYLELWLEKHHGR